MTHPRRRAAAEAIAAKDPRGRIRVVADPDPSGPPTALRTADPSWSCAGADATHHVVFQDDVLIAENFFPYLEKVAAAVPGEAVAFYEGWEGRNSGVVRLGALTGAHWAYAIDEHVPSLALMLPAEAARGYQRFAAEHGNGWPYDVVIQRYLKALGIPVRIAVPSTVDHDDVPSIAGNSTHGWRRATFFTDRAEFFPEQTDNGACPQFSVVPFYQYGESKCAVRHPDGWEYPDTDRHLRRVGLLDRCDAAFAAADLPGLPEAVCRQVWLTAFATGVVAAGLTERDPEPAVAAAVMDSLGPGGLCEEYTGAELVPMIPLVRDLALTAFAAGRAAHRATAATPRPAPAPGVVVTGGDPAFGAQLARLLTDAGCAAVHAERLDPAAPHLPRTPDAVVHAGDPHDTGYPLADLLADAEKLGARRLIHVGSAAVYRGGGAEDRTEDSVRERPEDAGARPWWDAEEQCRSWGRQTRTPVQIVRRAEPVGPHAPLGGVLADWMLRAWTRRPMTLTEGRRHQIVDHRDLAGALAALLARPAGAEIYNVASAAYDETAFAELVAETARRTPWEQAAAPAPHTPVMSTALITAETGWEPSAAVRDGARAQAQWLACDTHDDLTGLWRTPGAAGSAPESTGARQAADG
ncbi:NAD-dependent epimerase/dehydratase family protein [Streptomyces naphthomycinicus]|uniref:NAD-dependent epimerase/dehydratase family protein n=1 Tax=Streptomyces naphthomycinicus TaxID=2872625 RepID=UPI001CEDEA92|nr:NAD(P)-dependent oxidoreductase [Streptomyces sp. TML10]